MVIAVDEDQDVDFVIQRSQQGQRRYQLRVGDSDEPRRPTLDALGYLAPAASQPLKCRIHGSYKVKPTGEIDPAGTIAAIELRLRHTDQAGQWRDAADGIVNVPVKVHGKKTKLETDALAGFDEV